MTETKFATTRRQTQNNDPPVKVGQIWFGKLEDGEISRRIRILALLSPNSLYYSRKSNKGERAWIFEELSGGIFRTEIGRLGICPEFNLRYVFEVEDVSS